MKTTWEAPGTRAVGSGAAGAANHQPPELINDERRGKTTAGDRNRTVPREPLAAEYLSAAKSRPWGALGRRRGQRGRGCVGGGHGDHHHSSGKRRAGLSRAGAVGIPCAPRAGVPGAISPPSRTTVPLVSPLGVSTTDGNLGSGVREVKSRGTPPSSLHPFHCNRSLWMMIN